MTSSITAPREARSSCLSNLGPSTLGAAVLSAAVLLSLSQPAAAQQRAEADDEADSSPEVEPTDAAVAPDEAVPAQEPVAEASASTPVATATLKEDDAPCDTSTTDEAPVPFAAPSSSLSPEQNRALWPLRWKKSPGQGFSFGMEEGLWGNTWSQGLRVTIPFTRYLGTTLRGVYLIEMGAEEFTSDAGGRVDFFGRSPALFNVVRLYGGGGVQVLAPATNTNGRQAKVGVGGHFGFEFFHNPYFSYFLEVGGQGGEPYPGATVVAGMMIYPWTR